MLCTVEQVKTRLGRTDEADTADDAAILVCCRMASHWLAGWVDAMDHDPPDGQAPRSLLEYFVDRVQLVNVEERQSWVRLRGFPIVAVSEVVASSTLGGLDAATPLVENTDWWRALRTIERLSSGRNLGQPFTVPGGFVRVTYSGGYWPADGEEIIPEGWQPVPDEKRDAAVEVAMHLFKHRDHFGQRLTNVGTATISEVVTRIEGLVGVVESAFGHLRRVGVG